MADGAAVRATIHAINNAGLQTFLHTVTQDLNQQPQPSAWLPKQEMFFPDRNDQDQFRISCDLEAAEVSSPLPLATSTHFFTSSLLSSPIPPN